MRFSHPISRYLALLTILLAILILPSSQPTVFAQDDDPIPPAPRNDFYGANFIAPIEPWLGLAAEGGLGVVRWQFNWRDHETSKGVWRWEAADVPIQTWNEKGFKVHAIMHNPPDYALANSGGLMPINLDLAWDDPNNHWGEYCNRFATRYRGQIDSYEIWNEPDLDNYWEGTSKDYYLLLKTCYLAIKAADPNVPVSMAGMAILIEPNFFPEVVAYAANDAEGAANNHFFDVMSIHMYAAPQLGYDLTMQTRSVLAEYGMDSKPIWITEVGVALQGYGNAPNQPKWGYATENEAAWYLVALVSNAIAADVDRVMWFRLADDGMTEAFGLLRNNGSPRPSYEALQMVSSLLYDIVEVKREIRDDVVIVEMRRADGARIVSMYTHNGTGRNIKIPATAPAAALVNTAGESFAVRPNAAGEYAIHVPEARGRDFEKLYNYSVGGPPVLLIEFDDVPPIAKIEAIPIEGDQRHIILKWSSDDGAFGTGAVRYDIEFSRDGGLSWSIWDLDITETEAVFDVSSDGRYLFRVRATDHYDNIGDFSPHAEFSSKQVGTLVGQILDLRGQLIPFARVTLADGSLHDADETGHINIEIQPGTAFITGINGATQGTLIPTPVEVKLGEATPVNWMLLPHENLTGNGNFDQALDGWTISAPSDVWVIPAEGRGNILSLNGGRRPWGNPALSAEIDIPSGMVAGVLSFQYRIPSAGGQSLRVRVETATGEQVILWENNGVSRDFLRVWLEMGQFAGQRVTLYFELWGEKGSPQISVEIDDIIFGNVPVLPNDN